MYNQSVAAQAEFLTLAITDGDTTKLLQLLQQNDVNVTAFDENGDTVLHLILRNDKFPPRLPLAKIIEMMDILISRGVDPNIKNKHQETVLHLAIEKQLKDVVDYLLKRKSNINVIDINGNSIAHHFINNLCEQLRKKLFNKQYKHISDYVEIKKKDDSIFVEWLVSKGADFDLKNNKGQSALHLAIKYNLQHILWTLMKNTRDVNFVTEVEKENLLHLFLKTIYVNNRKPSLKFSYVPIFHVQYDDRTIIPQKIDYETIYPLHCNVFPPKFAIEIVQILLEHGVSVYHEDKDGLTPLHLAIRNKVQTVIIEMILDRFDNVSDELIVTLFYEVLKSKPFIDYLKILDNLTVKAFNINGKDANGKSCLYHAVMYEDLKAIELMQKKGALDFSLLTNNGENLLHALAEQDSRMFHYKNPPDQEAIFDMLISEGCDVHAKNCKGQTPLYWAARYLNTTVARKLIAHGAEVNCRDYEKKLCSLHEAISRGSVEVLELLLDNGANVNSKSMDGRPLHLATKFTRKDMLAILLKYKAEVNARDHEGDTAFAKALWVNCGQKYDFAIHFNCVSEGLQELLEYGADINDTSVIRVLPHCVKNLVGKILLQHWIKLRTADLHCSEEYQTYMYWEYQTYMVVNKRCKQAREDCLREIEILKNTFIDSRTSLYAWLRMDPDRRHIHNYNETLQKIVNSPTIKQQFPQYSTVILGNYRETLTRKSLFEPAKEAWLKLTEIHLPDICLERIFTYLNTGDMFEMAEILNEPVHS